MRKRTPALWALALGAGVLVGCQRDAVAPTGETGAVARAAWVATPFGLVREVRASRVHLPPRLRPWDTSVVALEAELRRTQGYAFVAFKPAAAPRTFEAGGMRNAVPATVAASALSGLSAEGVQVLRVYRNLAAAYVRLDPARAATLWRHPLVDIIEPLGDVVVDASAIAQQVMARPASATSSLSQSQTVPWGITLVGAPQAWAMATGVGARIMIMDYGVASHSDLPGVLLNHCGGLFGACAPPENYGTMEAGVLLARNNTQAVVGVAPGVRSVDLFTWRFCWTQSPDTICNRDTEYVGFDAAVDSAVRVVAITVSFKVYDPGEAYWVGQLWSEGIIVVGRVPENGSGPIQAHPDSTWPVSLQNVVGVSGVLPDTSFADSSICGTYASKYGSMVDISAPFWGLSTGNDEDLWYGCGNWISQMHVVGALAALIERYPSWSATTLINRIYESALDRGPIGWDNHFGRGVVSVYAALQDPPIPPDPPLNVGISGPNTVPPWATCSFFASASGGSEPYTFTWFVDGSPAGTGQTLYWSAGTSYTILLEAVDPAGKHGSAQMSVTVSPSTPSCSEQ